MPDEKIESTQRIPSRIPPQDLLINFLKKNNMSFVIRKQKVRYIEDNGLVIEPPVVVVQYNDVVDQSNQTINQNGN